MQLFVEGPGQPGPPQPARRKRPKTPVTRFTEPTFTAPASEPGGLRHRGTWAAESTDKLWRYSRSEADVLHWTVTYTPTGQTRAFNNLDLPGGAREATAGGLLDELRGEALAAAFDADSDERRAAGQRWLAIHMRLGGHTHVDAECACGGLVAIVRKDGRYAHVDACAECRDTLPDGCPAVEAHRFCAWPDPQLSDLERRVLRFEARWWSKPGAKLAAIREEFAGMSEIRYYAMLNRLLDRPEALAADPVLVRRLLRVRDRRTGRLAGGKT